MKKNNDTGRNLLIQFGLVIIIAIMLLISAVDVSAQDTVMRRYALYVGSNYGGRDRVTLSYAVTDARTISEVMQQLGGVMPTDSVILTDPSPAMVNHTISEISKNIKSDTAKRSEFFFYYSGHSDEKGLLLGDSVYRYEDLKDAIESAEADVNIAVLDSCSSGAFTRMKGGVRRTPFLSDDSVDAKGHAFLTSSSEDEAAQESDDLGASFFTHYFVTALRGAADSTLDGTVSLNEAYSYASSETLARTEDTLAGPQHPSYDIQLAGSGELVLTDLRSVSEQIMFEENMRGRIFIRDSAGRLVVELKKIQGTPLAISIGPGRYSMILDDGENLLSADLVLTGGSKVLVMRDEFYPVPRSVNQARGGTHVAADDGRNVDKPAVTGAEPADESTIDTASELDEVAANARQRALEAAGMESAEAGAEKAAAEAEAAKASLQENDTATELDIIAERARKRALEAAGMTDAEDTEPADIRKETDQPAEDEPVSFGSGTQEQNSDSEQKEETGDVRSGLSIGFVPNVSNLNGVQVGAIGAEASGTLNGIQVAGIFSEVGGNLWGLQTAGIWSATSGDMEGIQISGIWNSADNVSLLQVGGIFNIAEGNVRGVQCGGIFNTAGGTVLGSQISGIFNVSGDMFGLQMSPILNIAEAVKGAQIGLVNIGGVVDGVQVGLVNVSEELNGFPIGLINISTEGLHDVSCWYSHNGELNFGFQLGTSTAYSFVTAGVSDDFYESISVGLGMGLELGIEDFFFDVDLYAKSFQTGKGDILMNMQSIFTGGADIFPAARLTAGVELFDFVSIFAGVNLDCSVLSTYEGYAFEIGEISASSYSGYVTPLDIVHDYGRVSIYPTWIIGVRI